MMRRSRHAALLSTLAIVALVGAGCSSAEKEADDAQTPATTQTAAASDTSAAASPSPSPSESASSQPAGQVVDIVIKGGKVTPGANRVQVKAGEEFTLSVNSDVADELHVHSTPEQSFTIEPGEQELKLTIERPGIVDAELHELGQVAVQLEVR